MIFPRKNGQQVVDGVTGPGGRYPIYDFTSSAPRGGHMIHSSCARLTRTSIKQSKWSCDGWPGQAPAMTGNEQLQSLYAALPCRLKKSAARRFISVGDTSSIW